jgi:hypothetical protein
LASLVDGLQPVPSMDTTSSIPIPAARPLRRPAIRAQNNDVNIQNVAQSSSPRPPASVGGQAKNAQANRQKTILDVILGN